MVVTLRAPKPRRLLTKAPLLACSTIFSLFVLEIALRVISPPSPFGPLLPLLPHSKMELHTSNLRGVSPVAMHSTNKWGLRGDEPPADWSKQYTIITIGGSTTQCFYLDDHKTWPYLLQGKLRDSYPGAWVGNGGLDGHSTRGHVVFMQEVVKRVNPNVVVLLVGVNDLGLLLDQDAKLNGSVYERVGLKYRLLASSRLLQILYTWKRVLFDRVAVVDRSGYGSPEPQPLPEPENLTQVQEDLPSSLQEYHANIEKIIQEARSLNIRVIFLTQPMLFDDTVYWRGIEGAFYWIKNSKGKLSAATFWKLLDLYNKELIRTCQLENVECFDLASAVPHSDLYFYDYVHFNEQGAELAAEKVSGYLEKQH